MRHPFTTASSATGIPQILDALGIASDELYEWKPYDSVGEFFRTGHVFSNNINVRGSTSDGTVNYNINYGNLEDVGFTPGNTVNRNTLSFGGNSQLSNGFVVGGMGSKTRIGRSWQKINVGDTYLDYADPSCLHFKGESGGFVQMIPNDSLLYCFCSRDRRETFSEPIPEHFTRTNGS